MDSIRVLGSVIERDYPLSELLRRPDVSYADLMTVAAILKKRKVTPPKRLKRIASFQRPSSMPIACSMPCAADIGV